jgi:flavin-dependent dehydrogenase
MSQYDVIVIGGGIGGSAAAIGLAQQGASVLVLEAGRTPRHKMCGEFLSPETVPIFRRLGVWEPIANLVPSPMQGVRLTAMKGTIVESGLPPGAMGLSRYQLDDILLKAARQNGAEVRENAQVSGVTGTLANGFQVKTATAEHRARVVIGAWGKRSTVDRALERPFFQKNAPFLALKRHVRGIEPNGLVELHGFDGGYCGVNGVEGGVVNVCLLTSWRAWERSGKEIGAFWRMIQQENRHLAERLRGSEAVSEDIVISNISFAARAAVEWDILMVGDSAALISPLAGNGQAMALQAAEVASELVGVYLAGAIQPEDLKEGYRHQWQGLFGERLRLGRLLQPLFLNPTALALGLRVGHSFPSLVQWLVAGTRQRQLTVDSSRQQRRHGDT